MWILYYIHSNVKSTESANESNLRTIQDHVNLALYITYLSRCLLNFILLGPPPLVGVHPPILQVMDILFETQACISSSTVEFSSHDPISLLCPLLLPDPSSLLHPVHLSGIQRNKFLLPRQNLIRHQLFICHLERHPAFTNIRYQI